MVEIVEYLREFRSSVVPIHDCAGIEGAGIENGSKIKAHTLSMCVRLWFNEAERLVSSGVSKAMLSEVHFLDISATEPGILARTSIGRRIVQFGIGSMSASLSRPEPMSRLNTFGIPWSVWGYNQEEMLLNHVFRHEMGHLLTTGKAEDSFWSMMADLVDDPSSQGPHYFASHVSQYASEHQDEAIAEAFAYRFAPGYKMGSMDRKLESFAEQLAKGF